MKINWKDVDKYENTYKLVENYNVYGFVFDCMDDMEQASKQFRNLYARMIYSVQKNEKYKGVAGIKLSRWKELLQGSAKKRLKGSTKTTSNWKKYKKTYSWIYFIECGSARTI